MVVLDLKIDNSPLPHLLLLLYKINNPVREEEKCVVWGFRETEKQCTIQGPSTFKRVKSLSQTQGWKMRVIRGEDEVAKGGRSWSVVDSKLFEILVEDMRGKLKGCIWERSRGISSWIRFGEVSLQCLLEGVEACCKEVDN